MRPHRTAFVFKSALLGLAVVFASTADAVQAHPANKPGVAAEPRQKAKDKKDELPLLTDEQIHLINVYEIILGEKHTPKIRFEKSRLEEFLEEFGEDDRVPRGRAKQKAWLEADGAKQLELIFKLKARDYYKDAKLTGRVEPIRQWSTHHRRHVLGYFEKYFGGGKVEGLHIVPNGAGDAKRVEITNFYLLSRAQIDGQWVIDRTNPEDSLLLQWALPHDEAKYDAPEIKGWKPLFRTPDDRRFKEIVAWIKTMHRFNQGADYGFEYKLPSSKKPEKENDKKS